ncbi:MAG: 30S ribosomal protein S11 [Candidatus Spechtbacterales bacterium]|nr:30S ribosomal protein S11 [Candidatus Spechtbacterales bacterium]
MGKKRVATIKGGGGSKKAKAKAAKKKKKPRVVERANFHIKASYNNTMLSATDENGNVLAWASAGGAGFKGPRKATPYAATQVVDILLEKLEKIDMKQVHISVSGIGSGRDSAIRALTGKGLNVVSIKDVTSVPHNGCRPPKPRRV